MDLINGRKFILETRGPNDKEWSCLNTYDYEPSNARSFQEARKKVEQSRATWGRQDEFRDHVFNIRVVA